MFKIRIFKRLVLILFGVTLSLILIEFSLRLVGYIYLSKQDLSNRKSLEGKLDYRILVLGESTTEMGGDSAWPKQLEKILNEKIPNKKFAVINKGKSGTNSYRILSEIEDNLNEYKPDMVITMMGLNDGAVPDLKVYDEALSVNIAKSPDKEDGPVLLKHLKVYKFVNLLRVLIQRELGKLDSMNKIVLPVFASENLEGNFELEERVLKDPGNDSLHVELGNLYMSKHRNEDAAREFLKALKINPDNYEAYVGMGDHYKNQIMDDRAEQIYRKAIEIEPQKPLGYSRLGVHLRDLSRYDGSEWAFKKMIDLGLEGAEPYRELAVTYRYWGKYEQAEKVLKDMLTIGPNNESNSKVAYYELENLYRQMGDENRANEVSGKVLGLNSALVSNYRKLKQIVLAHGIKLVAVQYPTRNVETLKNLVGANDVILVDNEKIFVDAIKKGKYEDYFIDRFGGDFGHGTPKGNYLLASNIANILLKEIFNQK